MRKLLFPLIIFIMVICSFPQISSARTGYVSDMLLLTFRQGPGSNYDVIKTLQSNTPVIIMEERNGFYKVLLKSKAVGWVDKKFISFELPKTYIIEQLKQKNKNLESKISKVEASKQSIKEKNLSEKNKNSKKINSLEASLKAALTEKEKISATLSINKKKYDTLIEQSKNIQTIVKENKALHEDNKKLSKDLKESKNKNKNLFKTGMIKWSGFGVAVLLLGWIIGRSVSSKKRSSGSLLG
ncbi:MAG: SH3 domain-containing protein [Desulfobacteraceae bacterium]|nr:SH3 domain-containing protein [Desulfobacteraceae bacterium]